jgi:hypothetical protein
MAPDTERLLRELVSAASTLCTTVELALDDDERLSAMLNPSIGNVRAIIALCPSVEDSLWEGNELREEDIIEDIFNATYGAKGTAVKLVHKPTGIGRVSESKPTAEENRAVARKALTAAVRKEMSRRGRG